MQIPDVQFTGSLGPEGAIQFDLLDASTSTLTLNQFVDYWDDVGNAKGPAVCMRSSDWASVKADLETLCSWVQGGCTLAQQQALTNFTAEINTISKKDKD